MGCSSEPAEPTLVPGSQPLSRVPTSLLSPVKDPVVQGRAGRKEDSFPMGFSSAPSDMVAGAAFDAWSTNCSMEIVMEVRVCQYRRIYLLTRHFGSGISLIQISTLIFFLSLQICSPFAGIMHTNSDEVGRLVR